MTFQQDYKTDAILLQADKHNSLPYAAKYLKMSIDEAETRLKWLSRQPKQYLTRLRGMVMKMEIARDRIFANE